MKTVKLSPTDVEFFEATHKFIITWEDLKALAAAPTGVIDLLTVVRGTLLEGGRVQLVTPFEFSNVGIDSLTVQIGITGGTTNSYLAATELALANAGEVFHYVATTAGAKKVFNDPALISALFTVTTGTTPYVNTATKGELHIYLSVKSVLPAQVISGALPAT